MTVPIDSVDRGYWKPVSILLQVDFRCRKFELCDLGTFIKYHDIQTEKSVM